MLLRTRTRRILMPSLACILAQAGTGATRADATHCRNVNLEIAAERVPYIENATACLVNEVRQSFGVQPLARNPLLDGIARAHSRDMAARGYFSHEDPEGQGPSDRARAAGYQGGVGENIALRSPASTATARLALTAWLASQGHCVNILRPVFRDIGSGAAVGPGANGGIFTHVFGVPLAQLVPPNPDVTARCPLASSAVDAYPARDDPGEVVLAATRGTVRLRCRARGRCAVRRMVIRVTAIAPTVVPVSFTRADSKASARRTRFTTRGVRRVRLRSGVTRWRFDGKVKPPRGRGRRLLAPGRYSLRFGARMDAVTSTVVVRRR